MSWLFQMRTLTRAWKCEQKGTPYNNVKRNMWYGIDLIRLAGDALREDREGWLDVALIGGVNDVLAYLLKAFVEVSHLPAWLNIDFIIPIRILIKYDICTCSQRASGSSTGSFQDSEESFSMRLWPHMPTLPRSGYRSPYPQCSSLPRPTWKWPNIAALAERGYNWLRAHLSSNSSVLPCSL